VIDLIDALGDANVLMLIGLVTGLCFGGFAQQSQFCLRAATVEFWRGRAGSKFAIWMLAFSVALFVTQLLIPAGLLDPDNVRQLNGTGSLSGAIVGGAMFGVGMIFARGCASRLLVLSGCGNLRALLTGLVLTVVAQASLRGALSPMRESVASWWTISGSMRSLGAWLGQHLQVGLFIGICLLLLAAWQSRRANLSMSTVVASIGVGLCIALGWGLTSWHAQSTFEIPAVQSITFTGPSTDTLMALINQPELLRTFGSGLVPGVFLGALCTALITRQFALQVFTADTGTGRYLAGASLMGFGSMLAGGCAVGAGMTGGAVLATTAWTALLAMWIAAGLTDFLLQRSTSLQIVGGHPA
jgi:uncharacterized membrane protein YedE/YeeE